VFIISISKTIRRKFRRHSAAVSYMNGSVILAVTRGNTPTIMVHFSATSDACNVPYVNVYDTSRHCTTTDTEFGIVAFVRKYRLRYFCVSMILPSALYMVLCVQRR
jgi:hypothetical protein